MFSILCSAYTPSQCLAQDSVHPVFSLDTLQFLACSSQYHILHYSGLHAVAAV